METFVNGQSQWLYVSENGQILTDEEIASKSGGIVHARMERGIRVLSGSGVIWGGADAKDTGDGGRSFPVPARQRRARRSGRQVGRSSRCRLAHRVWRCWPPLRGSSPRRGGFSRRLRPLTNEGMVWIKRQRMRWCSGRARFSWEALRSG